MLTNVFYVACFIIMVVSTCLMLHDDYQDGILGRFFLGTMAFTTGTFLGEALQGQGYEMLRQTVLLTCAVALFMLWHFVRFLLRIRRMKKPKTELNNGAERRAMLDRRFN